MAIKAILFDWGGTLMREFPEYYQENADWSRVETMPGVSEVLTALSKDYDLYVASNWSGRFAERLPIALEQVNIKKFFKEIFTAKSLGVLKPEPRFYKEILKRIEADPQEVVMVGDDLHNDVIAAKQAGLFAVMYTTFTPYDMKEGGDAVIYSMHGLPRVISNL